MVGDRIAIIALVFLVIHLSNSYAPALALFYACRVLPTLLGGLLVGVFVDHVDRRRLMVGCDLSRAVLLAAVPALSGLTLGSLYPLVLVLYALTLLFDTAARAALPDVVPEAKLLGANAILNGIQTSADLAYAVGGALVFILNLQTPFYIDAATFLVSALLVSKMRIPGHERGPLPNVGEVLARIRVGVDFLMGHPFLKWSTFTFAIAPVAGGGVFVLAPLYADHVLAHSAGLVGTLRSGAFRFSVLEVSIGVGALLGSALAQRLVQRFPKGRLFGLGVVGTGLMDALLGSITNLYVASAVLALSGFFNSLFIISGVTLVQSLTPTEMRGRVVAARSTVINTALAVGSALGGVVLLIVPYRTMWFLLGGMIMASSLFVWLRADVRNQR